MSAAAAVRGGRGRGGVRVAGPEFELAEIEMSFWERRTVKGFAYAVSYSRAGRDYNPGVGFEVRNDYSHYIVNLLWVVVNSLCLVLTATHLYRLRRDLIRSKRNYHIQYEQSHRQQRTG